MSALHDKLMNRRAAERKAAGLGRIPASQPSSTPARRYGFQVRPTPHQFERMEAPVPVAAQHPEVQMALQLFWHKEAA